MIKMLMFRVFLHSAKKKDAKEKKRLEGKSSVGRSGKEMNKTEKLANRHQANTYCPLNILSIVVCSR